MIYFFLLKLFEIICYVYLVQLSSFLYSDDMFIVKFKRLEVSIFEKKKRIVHEILIAFKCVIKNLIVHTEIYIVFIIFFIFSGYYFITCWEFFFF